MPDSFSSQILDALFANRCTLCNRLGSSCCDDCWANLPFQEREVRRFKGGELGLQGGELGLQGSEAALKGISMIDFDAKVATLIHAYKDQARTSLIRRFADAMVQSVESLASMGEHPMHSFIDGHSLHLVAVPSRVSSIQQRGFSPAALISRALVSRLNARFRSGNHLVWRSTESADQASLGQEQRKENLVGTMQASPKAAGKRVILIDDIVTTGSSLVETARALETVEAEILGFVTFSETILRNIAKSHTNETKRV